MPLEHQPLAPYAMASCATAGREFPEPVHPYRGPFQRDRDRIVHSSAFRRLAHKTQVFTGALGDYHRSRLTHTLEVASIARTVGRVLGLNEDLIEALALIHDIGHPPFGHAGEKVLDHCCRDRGGFSHNAHALRLVTLLESRYPEFPGLNLSREVLDGQQSRIRTKDQPPSSQPLLEVQVVDAADSIAYDSHDADDALELGLLQFDDLQAVPLWREAVQHVRNQGYECDRDRFRWAVVHRLIEFLVSDLVEATRRRLAAEKIESTQAATSHRHRLVAPSADVAAQKQQLESFLFQHVYRHPNVLAEREVAGEAIRQMFDTFTREPHRLPEKYQSRIDEDGVERAACDYLASMTDRFALGEHGRLSGTRAD